MPTVKRRRKSEKKSGEEEAMLGAALGISRAYIPLRSLELKRKAVEAALNGGRSVCIVGPVGSGKTTLAREILRSRKHLAIEPFDPLPIPCARSPSASSLAFPSLLPQRDNQLLFVDDAESYASQALASLLSCTKQLLLTCSRDLRLDNVAVVELNAMSPTIVCKLLDSFTGSSRDCLEDCEGDARVALWFGWEERVLGGTFAREQRGVHMLHAIGRILFPRKSLAWPAIATDPHFCSSPVFHAYLYHNSSPFLADLQEAAVVAETFSQFSQHRGCEEVSLPALALWSLVNARPARKVPFGFSKPADSFIESPRAHFSMRPPHSG